MRQPAADPPLSQRRLMAFPLGIAGGERPPAEGGMDVHMPTLRDAARGIETGGSLPSTAACPGAAAALRRTCRNCKTVSHIRKRWRAHENGVSVHMHPVV